MLFYKSSLPARLAGVIALLCLLGWLLGSVL